MSLKRVLWLMCLSLILGSLYGNLAAQETSNDPYDILNRMFQASGGLERLKAEKTSYVEGTLAVAGMNGTIKVWQSRPGKTRADVELGPLVIKQGDNGEYRWVVDQNGKLQKITKDDEATRIRQQLSDRMAVYEHADPNSEIFDVTFNGTEDIEGTSCFVLTITNTLNKDTTTLYVNRQTYLPVKSVSLAGDDSSDSFTSDYREVSGMMVPFHTREISHQSGQEQVIVIESYESNPSIDDSMFDAPGEAGRDFVFHNGDRSENIMARLVGNHLMIPVIVDCKERWWVLDSGAGMSVIAKKFADELGLVMEGDMKGVGAGGTVDISFTKVPAYEIDGISFEDQTLAVMDMVELNRLFGLDIAGILGYDFLSRFVTRVDFANELLSFYDPATFDYSGTGNQVDLHFKEGVFEVEATLDGKLTGTWLFDLGASAVSLGYRVAVDNGYDKLPSQKSIGRGAGNQFITQSVRSQRIDFAGYTVNDLRVGFHETGAETSQLGDRLGILGNNLFRNFVMYIDYANERVIVEEGDKFNQPWPEDNSGLQLAIGENDPVVVIYVSPDSPAEKAGFQEGDVVVEVNGIPVELFDGVLAVRKVLQEDPGTELSITVNRAGSQKAIKLKLGKML